MLGLCIPGVMEWFLAAMALNDEKGFLMGFMFGHACKPSDDVECMTSAWPLHARHDGVGSDGP